MNYDTLRQEGIKQIERLGSTFWTDYNAHDPGITILEQLCYALTDLLYRIDYDIADILAEGGSDPFASLSRPEKILPSNPLTLQDLRKLAIRMPGVRNAWIERAEQIPIIYFNKEEGKINIYQDDETAPFVLRGLYRIEIEEEGYGNININEIKNKLHGYRNIAEDFSSITILEKQKVCIDAIIEIENTEEYRKIQIDIYNKIEDYFSPHVKFYSLPERLNTIKYVDEIFEGPFFEEDSLKHGFIDSQELQRASRRTELRTSDIIHILMDIQGVRAVQEISLRLTGNDNKADWLLQLDSSKVPRLDKEGSNIKLTKGDVEIHLSLSADTADTSYSRLPPQKLPLPAGRNRQIDNYYSIQHQFPDTYGVNKSGLPASASPLRKAQAKQLKAYLLLFDQLLANSFSQLANMRKLFSFAEEDAGSSTYFSQVIHDAELGIDEIYRGIWTDDKLKKLVKSSDDNERRNRFLNHLLARFAEQLVLPPSKEQKEQLQFKRKYLQNYEEISLLRSTAANYWQKSRCRTGLERRISLKLGIDDNAFCLIEHILLRPIPEDLSQNKNIEILSLTKPDEIDNDPYSLRITLILSASSLPEGERDAVQQQMLEEIPAHLKASFLWLSQSDFSEFEKSYATWWNLLGEDTSIRRQKLRAARDRIIDLIGLGRTYPLSDLDVESDMVDYGNKGKIYLKFNQTDVLYYLCDNNGKRLQDEDGQPLLAGVANNDGAISLETPVVTENVTYKILACKKNKSDHSEEKYKTFLQKKAVVKVGLNVFLEVEISAEIDVDGNTMPADAALAVTAARPILFSSRVKVKIKDAQEGVLYKLYARNGAQEILLSEEKGALGLGKGNFIELESVELNADTVIFVKAEGVVQEWLNSTLSVLVRANTDLNIAHSPSSVLAFNKDEASIKISKSQKGVRYQAYLHEISDDEFVYGEYLPNLLKTNEPDVHIKQPAWQAVWQETPAGYAEKPDKEVEGNDGEIELKLGRLWQDSLIIIKAIKEHQEGIPSKVQLKSALAFLIKPDHSKIPRIKINLTAGNLYFLQVEDGETGVFYHFRLKQEGKEICLPAYFHQWEEGNAENKGIERLRIERDFVIADSETKPKYLELQLDQPLQINEESFLHIRARKARTNVWVDFEPPIPISTLPKIEH